MTRFTSAYRSFVSRLDEVETLRREASRLERQDAVGKLRQINAMCRGAVILLSSHVEAYIKELGENALESFYQRKVDRSKFSPVLFYHISKDFFEVISSTDDHSRAAERLFGFIEADSAYWSRSGHFPSQVPIDRFNRGFSNPAFKKVKSYFRRFGYDAYKADLEKFMKADFAPVTNMLNHLVDTRNNIAHGDPLSTKTPQEIETMIELVTYYCRATDDVFANWCRANFCPIRR